MLDFYTDLNNARKESDEKYVADQFIGEEIIEPDEGEMVYAEEPKKVETSNMLAELKEEVK